MHVKGVTYRVNKKTNRIITNSVVPLNSTVFKPVLAHCFCFLTLSSTVLVHSLLDSVV